MYLVWVLVMICVDGGWWWMGFPWIPRFFPRFSWKMFSPTACLLQSSGPGPDGLGSVGKFTWAADRWDVCGRSFWTEGCTQPKIKGKRHVTWCFYVFFFNLVLVKGYSPWCYWKLPTTHFMSWPITLQLPRNGLQLALCMNGAHGETAAKLQLSPREQHI